MAKTIVNVTLPIILAEIETVLETYPDHPYQQAFAIPDLRQVLIANVLSHVASCYIAVEQSQAEAVAISPSVSNVELSCLQTLIHAGIHRILRQEADQVQHQIPDVAHSGGAASDWFG